jgi:hypothetical protein
MDTFETYYSPFQQFIGIGDHEPVPALNHFRRPPEKNRGEFPHPWSPLTHSSVVRSSISLSGHQAPPQ